MSPMPFENHIWFQSVYLLSLANDILAFNINIYPYSHVILANDILAFHIDIYPVQSRYPSK